MSCVYGLSRQTSYNLCKDCRYSSDCYIFEKLNNEHLTEENYKMQQIYYNLSRGIITENKEYKVNDC